MLIIGAGSGNDVPGFVVAWGQACRRGRDRPGHQRDRPGVDHPDRPYNDPRVTIHLDDGRAFVRKTDRKYDLAIYALVDSLVLHSGYSSLRLESFLFTEQAFRDVKAKLKPGGVFAMYNYLPAGMGRRTAGEDGREGLRHQAAGHLAAVPGEDLPVG